MHRIGIVTDYFETIVSRKELEDWRIREDICLLVLENPDEAKKQLEQYRRKCLKGKKEIPKIQNQFYMKMMWLLSRSVLKAEELYRLSCKAVACTVAEENWQEKLTTLYLGPAELEAMLLAVWSLYLLGDIEKALKLYWKIKQLSRIEKGENKPSGKVFHYLTQKMGRKLDWIMPMLETDSIQALSIRQNMMYLCGMRQYDKELEMIEKLKQIIGADNLEKPYIQQEILFIETIWKYETNNITASEAMKLYYKALSYTFPVAYLSRGLLPFIRREEGMIISNIAYLYHKMGEANKAQELFEKLCAAFRPQQQLLKLNSSACAIMLGQYSSLLGDLRKYKDALIVDNINLQCEINHYSLFCVSDLLYNKAWDHYEIDKDKYEKEYRQEFLNSWKIAEFIKDWTSIAFYREREKKYLKEY